MTALPGLVLWTMFARTARWMLVGAIPLCGNHFKDFSYMHASQANLGALYRIELVLKPLGKTA